MRRRTWTTLSLVVLVSSFAGCGGKPKVLIGAVLPETGAAEDYGKAVRRGIDVAYSEVQARAGDLAYELELRIEDSGSDADRAAQLVSGLYSAGAYGVIAGVTSAEALAAVKVADSADRILLSPTATHPELSGSSDAFYRIFPSAREEAVTMINFANEHLKLDAVGLLSHDHANGLGARAAFVEVFKGTLLGDVKFHGGEDVAAAVAELLEAKPSAVFVAAAGEQLSLALRELQAQGFTANDQYIMATSALANPEVIADTGSAAERVYFTQPPFNPKSEEEPLLGFAKAYREKYGEEPDLYAGQGYDALRVMTAALDEGGAVLPSDFERGFKAIADFPGVAGNIQFRESGDVQKFMRVYFVRGGEPVDFLEARAEMLDEVRRKREEIDRRRRELMRQQQQE
jgi:branched-chain amino acid transport system substrate-binding protein